MFAAGLYKINEEHQRNDENELFIILNNKQNLTQIDINNIDVKFN